MARRDKTPIDKPKELQAALDRLGMNRDQFAEALNADGIKITSQAVWKWLKGKTRSVPGYVGFFLLNKYAISKETL